MRGAPSGASVVVGGPGLVELGQAVELLGVSSARWGAGRGPRIAGGVVASSVQKRFCV